MADGRRSLEILSLIPDFEVPESVGGRKLTLLSSVIDHQPFAAIEHRTPDIDLSKQEYNLLFFLHTDNLYRGILNFPIEVNHP